MALTSGIKLGPYEIVSLVGAGGMGEVYRARDTRLGRDVAIKVLPEALAHDADRLRQTTCPEATPETVCAFAPRHCAVSIGGWSLP